MAPPSRSLLRAPTISWPLVDTSATTTTNNTGDLEANADADVLEADDADIDFGLALALSDGVGKPPLPPDSGVATACTNSYEYDDNGGPVEGSGEIAANSEAFGDGNRGYYHDRWCAGCRSAGDWQHRLCRLHQLRRCLGTPMPKPMSSMVWNCGGVVAGCPASWSLLAHGGGIGNITNDEGSEISAESDALVIGTNDNRADSPRLCRCVRDLVGSRRRWSTPTEMAPPIRQRRDPHGRLGRQCHWACRDRRA